MSTLQTIAVVPARDKEESQLLAPVIQEWLQSSGVDTRTESEMREGADADALIALGGDGLMMRMAHSFPGMPLLGINFGKVGFLAMVERSHWQEVLTEVIEGDFTIEEGPTLVAQRRRLDSLHDVGWAINDVVVRSGMQMIEVEAYVDGRYVNTFPGDGMIVASPQGSTAYCMAAGGPILTGGVRGFALTPISPHSPIRTTLVVPEDSEIELVVKNDRDAFLILDGHVEDELQRSDVVKVTRGKHLFRLITTEQMNFYAAFQSKFNYLIRPGEVPSLGHERNET